MIDNERQNEMLTHMLRVEAGYQVHCSLQLQHPPPSHHPHLHPLVSSWRRYPIPAEPSHVSASPGCERDDGRCRWRGLRRGWRQGGHRPRGQHGRWHWSQRCRSDVQPLERDQIQSYGTVTVDISQGQCTLVHYNFTAIYQIGLAIKWWQSRCSSHIK